jgi:hypothetical protein
MIRGGPDWERFSAQDAWAINTNFIDDYVAWRSSR